MVLCDDCNRWVHIACDGITQQLYDELARSKDDHPYGAPPSIHPSIALTYHSMPAVPREAEISAIPTGTQGSRHHTNVLTSPSCTVLIRQPQLRPGQA